MKEKLSAVVSEKTGNVIAIFSNVDDAIDIAIGYETRSGEKFEIQDVSKFGAHEMIDREWVKQKADMIEIWLYASQPK